MVPTCPDVCLVWAVMFGHIWKFRKCQIFRTWQQKNPKTWTPLKAPLYLFRYSGLKWSFGCLTYKSWIRAGRSSLRQNNSWTSLSTSWAQAALNQYALIHSIDQNQFVCHQTFVLTYQVSQHSSQEATYIWQISRVEWKKNTIDVQSQFELACILCLARMANLRCC